MREPIDKVVRSRWFAGSVHGALWLLLYLTASDLGGRFPVYREADGSMPPPASIAPVEKLDALFESGMRVRLRPATNMLNLFATAHFAPPVTPPPPAPVTKKIQLAYLGYYEVENSTVKKQVIVKQGDAFLVKGVGANLTANLYVADANMLTLSLTNFPPLTNNPALTNLTTQTNILKLNTPKEVEVPIK